MTEYIQVPVPTELYPAVIRMVADYLADTGQSSHPGDETWLEIAQGDNYGMGHSWWSALRPEERQLFRAFIGKGQEELEAAALADSMGMAPGDLAGVLGPFQRRMARGPYPVALTSRATSVGGRRVKVLRLADGLRDVVLRVDDGSEPPEQPHFKPVKRRSASR